MLRKIPQELADFFSPEYLDLSEVKLNKPEAILDYHFRQDLKRFVELYDFKSMPAQKIQALVQNFLAERWDKIKNKPTAYPNTPKLPSTEFCLQLANKLSELQPTDEKGSATNYFTFLMPTVRAESIKNSISLSEIFITDDGHVVVIDDCLRVSKEQKRFCYIDPVTKNHVNLTGADIKHIKNHSAKTAAYYFAVEAYIDDCCIDSELEALIYGLLMHDEDVIDNFALFLDELKKITEGSDYCELMKKGSRLRMSEIWDLLKHNPLSHGVCAESLRYVRNYQKYEDFILKKYPHLSEWAIRRVEEARSSYREALKRDALHVGFNKFILSMISFKDDELKDIFVHKETDEILINFWKYLTFTQKNQLVGILNVERLTKILKAQPNYHEELQSAIRALQNQIFIAGGEEKNSLAKNVLAGVRKDRNKVSSDDNLISLTIIAHRTAVGVREPFNTMNLKSYAETVGALSKKSKQESRTTAASKSFLSLLFYGVMASLIVVATGGTALVGLTIAGAVVAGLAGTRFGYGAVSGWRRPPFHRTTVAALSFLRNREFKSGEKIIESSEVNVQKSLNDEKLTLEEHYKLGY